MAGEKTGDQCARTEPIADASLNYAETYFYVQSISSGTKAQNIMNKELSNRSQEDIKKYKTKVLNWETNDSTLR